MAVSKRSGAVAFTCVDGPFIGEKLYLNLMSHQIRVSADEPNWTPSTPVFTVKGVTGKYVRTERYDGFTLKWVEVKKNPYWIFLKD